MSKVHTTGILFFSCIIFFNFLQILPRNIFFDTIWYWAIFYFSFYVIYFSCILGPAFTIGVFVWIYILSNIIFGIDLDNIIEMILN